MRAGLLVTVTLLLAGCAHRNPSVVHEKNPAECATIAAGRMLHASLKRSRADSSCDVWWWAN